MLNNELYHGRSDRYLNLVDSKPHNALYERPAMLSQLPDIANKHILDLGCAGGWYSEQLQQRGALVVSVDGSIEMVQAACKRLGPDARIIHHDLNRPLEFLESHSQDGIVASLVFHYVEHWDRLFGECHRLLRPGGWLLFSTHHPAADFQRLGGDDYFQREQVTDDWGVFGKVRFYRRSLTEMTVSMQQAGFLIETIREPRPENEIAQQNPELFQRLLRQPDFILFKGITLPL